MKANREKRLNELEQQRREKQTRKDAEFEARQQVKQVTTATTQTGNSTGQQLVAICANPQQFLLCVRFQQTSSEASSLRDAQRPQEAVQGRQGCFTSGQ